MGHLACGHLTVLDGRVTIGALERPVRDDPELEVLTRRGLEHEAAYLQRLRAEGLTVVEIAEPDRSGPAGERWRRWSTLVGGVGRDRQWGYGVEM